LLFRYNMGICSQSIISFSIIKESVYNISWRLEVSGLAERARTHRERGKKIESSVNGKRRIRERASASVGLSVGLVAGALAAPGQAFGAASWETSATQVKVGTFPLLAALGIGIAVAVVAVIAFLQLTAKGKEARDAFPGAEVRDLEPERERPSEDQAWNEEEASAEEDDDASLTDYTIPMSRVLPFSDQAENADDREPRLVGLDGEHAGFSYRVLNRRLTFGRDPSRCSILFPLEAGEISRVHCTLKYDEETRLFILEDNGSSNGTFLASGERLEPGVRYELKNGERFSLSGKLHWFEVADEERRAV